MSPATHILVNGVCSDAVPASDRGLSLGDGVFETIAVDDGSPRHWATHSQRLSTGCRRLGLECPEPARLMAEAREAIGRTDCGVLRITVTCGPGGRGYARPVSPTPTRVVAFTPLAGGLPVPEPIAVRSCRLRLAIQPALAGIKHLNRLEQVLARAEWSDPAIAEGLLYDMDDCLTEATAANIFLIEDGRLRTPRLDRCGVAGVLRSCVLKAAEEFGMPVAVERLCRDDLLRAEEVFLANSITGIRSVHRIDERSCNAPGPLTDHLAKVVNSLEGVEYRSE